LFFERQNAFVGKFPQFEEIAMKKILSAVFAVFFAVSVYAQAAAPVASDCEAKAVSKDGKPLSGAAKASSIKKCEASKAPGASSCEAKAIDKNGKPLSGAAKASSIKKCEASK
jgi:hypothetical protein